MSIFFMIMGVPGSGKSTLAEQLIREEQAELIATDRLRQEYTGSESDFSREGRVFATARAQIVHTLSSGRNAIYDATNITRADRRRILKILPPGTEKICYYCKATIQTASIQNLHRQRVVPQPVITRMYQRLDEPKPEEGWDEIRIVQPGSLGELRAY